MAFELKNLSLEEVSAVDEPANKQSRVVLLKRDGGGKVSEQDERVTLIKRLQKYLGLDGGEFAKGERLGNRLRSLREDRELSLDEAASRLNQFLDTGSITGSTVGQIERGEIETPSAPVLSAFAQSYSVSVSSLENLLSGEPPESARVEQRDPNASRKGGKEKSMDNDELLKKVARLEAENAIGFAASVEDVDKALAAVADDDIRKAVEPRAQARRTELEKADLDKAQREFRQKLTPAMAKAFDDMDEDERRRFMNSFGKSDKADDPMVKTIDSLSKTNDELQKRLDKMEADAELTKTREAFQDLDGFVKVDDFAKSYIALAKHDREAADAMVDQTRALAKQAHQGGLFRVIGKDGNGEQSADGKIDKAVAKYREANPGVSPAEAMTKVLEQDPGLYDDYLAEAQ